MNIKYIFLFKKQISTYSFSVINRDSKKCITMKIVETFKYSLKNISQKEMNIAFLRCRPHFCLVCRWKNRQLKNPKIHYTRYVSFMIFAILRTSLLLIYNIISHHIIYEKIRYLFKDFR